jgi:hypothetical protein
MYLKEHPYNIDTNKNADETFSTTITITIAPPLRLSTVVGDCLAGARAALDYISWELADRYVPDLTRDPKRSKKFAFPIREPVDPPGDGYVNKINRLTNLVSQGYPALAVDEIQAVQPNHAGYTPLWWLNELVNVDKHRMPLLTIGSIDTFVATFSSAKVRIERPDGTLSDEQTIMAGDFTVKTRDLATKRITIHSDAMHMDAQPTGYVAFEDVTMPREPVDRTLEQIIECVVNVIPRFDRFFV